MVTSADTLLGITDSSSPCTEELIEWIDTAGHCQRLNRSWRESMSRLALVMLDLEMGCDVGRPIDEVSSNAWYVASRSSDSAWETDRTSSVKSGMRIWPSEVTRLLSTRMRSTMGSCTEPPCTPECRFSGGPSTVRRILMTPLMP